MTNDEKLMRIWKVACMYYEERLTQESIAERMGVSRPLVSKMLSEAEKYNIVTITVNSPGERNSALVNRMRGKFDIKNAIVVPKISEESTRNNAEIARALTSHLYQNYGSSKTVGIGWGTMVGELIDQIEIRDDSTHSVCEVFPLIGNSSVSSRNYHSNENVRRMSEVLHAEPNYLYAPAIFESESEMRFFKGTESYKKLEKSWRSLDVAIVNIGNYPSSPDFASAIRLGNELKRHKIAGRMLAYFYDESGNIIKSPTDYAIQIPVEILKNVKHVIGVCSVSANIKAITGALKTGLISEIVLAEDKVRALL